MTAAPATDAITEMPARPRAEPRPIALALQGVSRRYGSVVAVADLSLTVEAGEIVALVGHSGSGKSTLLRLIAGLERSSSGSIAVGGRVVASRGQFVPPEQRGIGMMFQDYALFPHLTVLDNVRFGLERMPRREAVERAKAALARVGLAGRAGDYPHALSGGEQQRVALVRALVPAPRILLMDEPFSNLDRRTRDRIRDETTALIRESKATAILVTHDPEDAMRIADRVMLMEAGRIARGGTTEELYSQPGSLLVARFFGDFNEVEGVVRNGAIPTPIGTFAAPGLAEGAAAVVCIRPHDLSLADRGAGSFAATVVGRAFVGDELVLTLWVLSLSQPLQVRAPVHAAAAVGDAVSVKLAAAGALVFPANG